jgi:CRP-like cAMP-binding protein
LGSGGPFGEVGGDGVVGLAGDVALEAADDRGDVDRYLSRTPATRTVCAAAALPSPRNATVTVTKPARVLVIRDRDFRAVVLRTPEIALKVLEVFAERLPPDPT